MRYINRSQIEEGESEAAFFSSFSGFDVLLDTMNWGLPDEWSLRLWRDNIMLDIGIPFPKSKPPRRIENDCEFIIDSSALHSDSHTCKEYSDFAQLQKMKLNALIDMIYRISGCKQARCYSG